MALQNLPPVFQEKRGVFVTIKRQGHLRGCIGVPYPRMPLGEALVEAAYRQPSRTPAFMPVSRGNSTISTSR